MSKSRARNRSSLRELEQTAYHEAGHAVAALHFGFIPDKVTIVKTDTALGHVEQRGLVLYQDYADRRHLQRMVSESIVCCYAGYEAERRFDPNTDGASSEKDFRDAFNLPRYYEVPPRYCSMVGDEVYMEYLERRQRQAQRLVRERWACIAHVAWALLRHKTLSGEEVNEIAKIL
jgi:ATP-dependent Zn protease